MNKDRVYNIIKFVLLIAGQEDDYINRDLGPIHFIKYVYLADLHYAMRNNGATYTGIKWRFHNFGPWSNDVYNGPQNLNQLLSYKASGKSRFKLIPEKEVHEKKLQWKIQSKSSR